MQRFRREQQELLDGKIMTLPPELRLRPSEQQELLDGKIRELPAGAAPAAAPPN